MGYPTPERRQRMAGTKPGPAPVGPAGASAVSSVEPSHKITHEDVVRGKATVNQYRKQQGITDSPPHAYCSAAPTPGTFLTLAAPCPDCGHATVLHVGVDHCPVCELVDLNGRARQLLDAGRVEITVQGRPVDEAYLRDLLNKQIARHGRRYLR